MYDDITEQVTTEPRFENRPFVARPSRDLLFMKWKKLLETEDKIFHRHPLNFPLNFRIELPFNARGELDKFVIFDMLFPFLAVFKL